MTRQQIMDDILRTTQNMSPEEAIEFYEELECDIASYREALKEENGIE